MIKLESMLMIGSAGRNAGKTKLACELIRRFSKKSDIIGIKVTSIDSRNSRCPRGGRGCGVCASLDGEFCLTEETDYSSGKDTAKMLAAGAKHVFWLRVQKEHLAAGAAALLKKIGPDTACVCESNSLRKVIEPGLFFIVKAQHEKMTKPSAVQVQDCADRIVVFDSKGYDFNIRQIKFVDSKWTMLEKATAIVMAGGQSRRTGTNKALLKVGSISLIEIICGQLCDMFEQVLISSSGREKLDFLDFEIVTDRIVGQGPLMGIASALAASKNELNFVIACDIPQINPAFVRRLLDYAEKADIVIPTTANDKFEPLFAVYRKSLLGTINEVLDSGRRKISELFSRCRIEYVQMHNYEWFVNLNTMAEYKKFLKKRSC